MRQEHSAADFGQSWGSTEKFGGQIAVDLNRLEWSEMEELVFVVAFLVARQPRSALFEVQRLVVVLIAVSLISSLHSCV